MAEASSQEKTEKATPRRLLDARKKGKAAKSQDLAGAASFLAAVMVVLATLSASARQVAQLQLAVERSFEQLSLPTLYALILESLRLVALLSIGPVLAAAAVSLLATWLQVGTIFSLDPVMPKLENLNPVSGLKKVFSRKSLVNFLMMCAKTAVVAVAVALLARQLLPDAIRVIHGNISSALEVARQAMLHFVLWCGSAFVALAVADFAYQRWQFGKDQMMSKADVKRESKEDDGDPHLKAERKRTATEQSAEEMLQHIRVASLVLLDSAGRCVVVIHRPKIYPLPVLLLRASGALTDEVLAQARLHRLTVAHDTELLARLYATASSPGSPVPTDLIDAVIAHLPRR